MPEEQVKCCCLGWNNFITSPDQSVCFAFLWAAVSVDLGKGLVGGGVTEMGGEGGGEREEDREKVQGLGEVGIKSLDRKSRRRGEVCE